MPYARFTQARVILVTVIEARFHMQRQEITLHVTDLPARAFVCWPEVAGAVAAAKLFLRMKSDAHHLACSLLHQFRRKQFLGETNTHADEHAEHSDEAGAL